MRNYDSNFYKISNTISGVRCVKIRTGEELFFCKDVCRMLGFRNYRNTMGLICNHGAGRYNVVIPGQGPRSTALIDARDVLNLINNSERKLEDTVVNLEKYVRA